MNAGTWDLPRRQLQYRLTERYSRSWITYTLQPSTTTRQVDIGTTECTGRKCVAQDLSSRIFYTTDKASHTHTSLPTHTSLKPKAVYPRAVYRPYSSCWLFLFIFDCLCGVLRFLYTLHSTRWPHVVVCADARRAYHNGLLWDLGLTVSCLGFARVTCDLSDFVIHPYSSTTSTRVHSVTG